MNYSVLMTVYQKDDPKHFSEAIESMLKQTVPTNDFILVCDGKLPIGLNRVIAGYGNKLKVIRLDKNYGLGIALNKGLASCSNELIARMDSDDISLPDRCEKQIREFENDDQLSVLSGTVQEFSGDVLLQKRALPEYNDEIIEWSRKRNPFNHPAVMFRKSAVIKAGGYTEDFHLFEDYDLWTRMLRNDEKAKNLTDVLLYMRVSDNTYKRRGGKNYAKALLKFHNHLRKSGWIDLRSFLTCAVPHAGVCVMPNTLRKKVYKTLRES